MITLAFRQEGDSSNPTLARPYGHQSTPGRVVIFDREGDRTKYVLELCQGGKYGCDGIDEFHYNGFLVPEFEVGHEADEDFRNWKFYPGTRSLGFTDPVQGRSWCFPELDDTFSKICHLDVKLPAMISPADGEVPSDSQVFFRGLKVMQYDDDLAETTAIWSANNALVLLDILREVGRLPLSRFQAFAATWKAFEARCDGTLTWDKGANFGGEVEIPRFDAHIVFSQSGGYAAALEAVLMRAPGVMIQRVNSGYRVLPDPDRASVHTFNSNNILKKGVTLTPPDPDTLYNFFIFTFQDLDDKDELGQRRYKRRQVTTDLSKMRDDNDGLLNTFGPYELGLMNQSLAERIGWYLARTMSMLNAERDTAEDPIYPLQFDVKGQMDSFHVARADYIEISDHYMVGLGTPLCRVIKETTHAKKGERTFTVRLTRTDVYRDTDHSPIQGAGYTLKISTNPSLPSGVMGTAYSKQLKGKGGVSPYSAWTISSGAAPDGLTLDADTGILSGTATEIGTFTFTIGMQDSSATPLTASKEFTIVIRSSATAPILDTDTAVPVVTVAPTVTKSDVTDEWVVFLQMPDSQGRTVTDGKVQVLKASDSSVVTTIPIAAVPTKSITMYAFDCKIRYAWRNQFDGDDGNGRGWSDWSPTTDAPGLGSAPPPPASGVTTFDFDPGDVRRLSVLGDILIP